MSSSEPDDSSTVGSENAPHGAFIPANEFWDGAGLPNLEGDVFKQHIGKSRKYLSIAFARMPDFSIHLLGR